MRAPDLRLAIAINQRVRGSDEWFDEPDELDRVESALQSIDGLVDPVEAAGVLAFRVTRAQGFAEGNQRTALLLSKWVLDNNGRETGAIEDHARVGVDDLTTVGEVTNDVCLDMLARCGL